MIPQRRPRAGETMPLIEGALEIDVAGVALQLLPQRGVFMPQEQALLVADLHIGKAVSFRRWGVPVPSGTTTETLAMLSAAIDACRARRVVFLGDFLHSARSHAPTTLAAVHRWREHHALASLILVRGNHDDRAGDPPATLRIEVVDEPLPLGGLWLAHHPAQRSEGYVLAGHLHPCISLGGRANDRLRLPCFHFGERVGVLPAFGAFTGMHGVRAAPGDRLFAVAGGAVKQVG